MRAISWCSRRSATLPMTPARTVPRRAMDKITSALAATDQEGVDVAAVKQAQAALDAVAEMVLPVGRAIPVTPEGRAGSGAAHHPARRSPPTRLTRSWKQAFAPKCTPQHRIAVAQRIGPINAFCGRATVAAVSPLGVMRRDALRGALKLCERAHDLQLKVAKGLPWPAVLNLSRASRSRTATAHSVRWVTSRSRSTREPQSPHIDERQRLARR